MIVYKWGNVCFTVSHIIQMWLWVYLEAHVWSSSRHYELCEYKQAEPCIMTAPDEALVLLRLGLGPRRCKTKALHKARQRPLTTSGREAVVRSSPPVAHTLAAVSLTSSRLPSFTRFMTSVALCRSTYFILLVIRVLRPPSKTALHIGWFFSLMPFWLPHLKSEWAATYLYGNPAN